VNKILASGIAALSIAGGSLAIAAINPFGAAFAQSDGGSTTTVPSEPSTPAPSTPSTPAPKQHSGNCPNMGNDTPSPSSNTNTSYTQVADRHHRGGGYSGV
jgi:hypothetical protein